MADLETIQDTVKDNNEKIGEICQGIAAINQRCIERGRMIDGHRKTLYGENGTGGVVANQNKILHKFKYLNNEDKNRKEWARKIIGPLISALLIAGILALLYMWKTNT